jgi:CheY-like chemotaxis protein
VSDRILIVDDNCDVADSLARLLTVLGYATKVVYDGETALQVAAEYGPDIAFVDIGMPGIDGYEVVQRIRQDGDGNSILVAHTGWSRGTDKQRAYDAGFDLHIAKPVRVETLNEILALLQPTCGATQAVRVRELASKLDSQCAV